MSGKKKREKFHLWVNKYDELKKISDSRGISVSELIREFPKKLEMPADSPKKARYITIDSETDEFIQTIADKYFNPSNKETGGNRGETINYLIMEYLKTKR